MGDGTESIGKPVGTRPAALRTRRKRLAAAWRHVREGRPATGHGAVGDPELVALVEEPYASAPEADRRLTELHDAFEERDDRRAVFLSIYDRVTSEVAERVERGNFEDADWVADYLVAFADLYREAVHAYEVGDLERLADPWQVAFETAERGDALAVQDAALGVNAHINYDLAFALDDVGVEREREQKYEDHRAVTEVLRRLVDAAQDRIAEYAPGFETVDEALGRLDERAAIFTIAQCRDSAWRNAVAMNSRFRLRRRFARWVTHATSTGIAYLVLGSRASVTVHDALQEFEETPPDPAGANDG